MNFAIQFQSVSKKFTLSHERKHAKRPSWLERLRQRGEWREEFWALKDVSFQIARGESVGLIGANGSGKSTALKLMTKILQPTSGRMMTHGRIAALLEVGAGFHPELSGRDNIFLNGSILGLRHAEIEKVYDEIVSFSELERFIDSPVKHYSSGMYARLGFAIAVHVRPDILLIDETLAVGDQMFQDKCMTKIREIQQRGVTIVLVSHSLDAVREVCIRGIWLEDGRVREDGPVNGVIDAYWGEVMRKEREQSKTMSERMADRWGSGDVEITQVEFYNGYGEPTCEFRTGQSFTVRIHYHAHQRIKQPMFGLAIHRADGVQVNGPNNIFGDRPIDMIEGIGVVEYAVPNLSLLQGNYALTAAIHDQFGAHTYDHHHMRYSFTVVPGGVSERYGMLHMPARWTHHNQIKSNNGHGITR